MHGGRTWKSSLPFCTERNGFGMLEPPSSRGDDTLLFSPLPNSMTTSVEPGRDTGSRTGGSKKASEQMLASTTIGTLRRRGEDTPWMTLGGGASSGRHAMSGGEARWGLVSETKNARDGSRRSLSRSPKVGRSGLGALARALSLSHAAGLSGCSGTEWLQLGGSNA